MAVEDSVHKNARAADYRLCRVLMAVAMNLQFSLV